MSAAVALDELAGHIERLGPLAFLVTTDGSSPHVVSVLVDLDGAVCTLSAGTTSRANMGATGRATLLWATADDYSLIVDGDTETDTDTVRLRPTRAVLHRSATASPELPSCVRIEA